MGRLYEWLLYKCIIRDGTCQRMMNGNFGNELGMPASDPIFTGEFNTRGRPRHTNEIEDLR